jgi:hypothetical protein
MMKHHTLSRWAAAALLLGSSLLSAQAGSLGTSSAVGGSSASAGSSASSDASSNSASSGQRAALGTYRITDVAEVAGQPGQVQLQLQALAADAPAPRHVLVLPQAIAARHRLAVGQTVTARPQPYGTEFVHGGSQQAFYLVLTDGFQRELAAQPVRL